MDSSQYNEINLMNKTIFNLIAIVEDCQLTFSEKLDRLSDRLSYRLQIALAKPDSKDWGWLLIQSV